MSGRDEWGPWVDHDGKGCPCVGRYVEIVVQDGVSEETIACDGPSWAWAPTYYHVLQYRIRKPKGLTMLEQIARDVKVPVEGVPE